MQLYKSKSQKLDLINLRKAYLNFCSKKLKKEFSSKIELDSSV